MRTIDDTDPIILEGECYFMYSQDNDDVPRLELYAYDSDEILTEMLAPIKDTPGMAGIVQAFKWRHEERMRVADGDLFDGREFLEDVKSGCIMDYDGMLRLVIVDGYRSNLGLCVPGAFNQGNFVVDVKTFARICDEHDVQVVWYNR